MQYYMMIGGQRKGPFPAEQLLAQGLQRDTLVWAQGMASWARADQVPDLSAVIATIPMPVQPPPQPAAPVAAPRAAGAYGARPRRQYDDEDEDDYRPARRFPETRYDPDSFGKLYISFLLLYLASFLILIVGVVCIIIGASQKTYSDEAYYRDTTGEGYGALYNPPLRKPDYAAQERQQVFMVIGFLVLGVAGLLSIGAAILQMILLYKAWNQIQDRYSKATPGQAIGFMFIPFFNLYWMFVAYKGLATDMNAYADRRGIDMPPVSEGMGLAYCIITLCTAIPYLGLLAVIPALVFLILFLNSVKNGSAAIARWKLQKAAA